MLGENGNGDIGKVPWEPKSNWTQLALTVNVYVFVYIRGIYLICVGREG